MNIPRIWISLLVLSLAGGALYLFLSREVWYEADNAPARNLFSEFKDGGGETQDEELEKQVKEKKSATTTSEYKNEIRYTTLGFNPAVFAIAVGDTVTFINESGKPFSPASSPHPRHTDFPEFDAKGPIEDGDIFEFIFEKPGDFGYHDHFRPEKVGVIRVVDISTEE